MDSNSLTVTGLSPEEFMMASELAALITPEVVFSAVGGMLLMLVWSFVWKGIALWKAAQNNSKPWFIALLLVNTVGILEIIYIFLIADKDKNKEGKQKGEISDAIIHAELEKLNAEKKEKEKEKESDTDSIEGKHLAQK